VGAALAVVSGFAAFLFNRFEYATLRNVAIFTAMLGAILALSGDVMTRQLGSSVDRERILEQPLLSANVSFRLVLRPSEQSAEKKNTTNAVVFMAGEGVVLVATHPMRRSGQSPDGLITLRANLDMEENGSAVGRPLSELNLVTRSAPGPRWFRYRRLRGRSSHSRGILVPSPQIHTGSTGLINAV